ncbi:hypothetical protein PR001_g24627 [Phytophthora rubi]|uniref:Uncharacterized protein n=1 Tax=Phytophthora rubi TaxID=129364 RepID=A0A6A3IFA9_9STRA|nr:hypothetical protein PR001_g24627 [Phytophthora rubi]
MRLSDRLRLQNRPSVLKQVKVRALKRSPDQVSLVCARRAVPAPFSWDKIRADVRELLLAGESFWDAVAEARKSHMLHDRFGKRALVDMLVFATYCLSWLHSSDDDEDDDKFDKTYRGKTTPSSGSASARSQSSTSGKRTRGSSSSGKGSATKIAKTSTQSTAGATSRLKAKLPAPLPDDGTIEPPKKGSWCHYGIKVQALNRQTMGFPSYMPVQPLLQHLHVRWVPIEYWELIQTCPWNDMWQQRISTLVFFKYSEMSLEMTEAITLILDFMSRWRREYWERYHWVTMDPGFDYYRTQELRAIPELADMYRDRKDRHSDFDNHRKKMMAEVEKSPGYSDRIWFEPGLWVVPQNPCYWITRDPELQISLQDQLVSVDDLEPARTQWATRQSEDVFLRLVPALLRNQLLSETEQLDNLLLPSPKYDQDTLVAVLAEVSKKKKSFS